MKVRKAVITAAGTHQRTLPLQTLIDRDGVEKPILRIILEEVLSANIEQACVVIAPGDEELYAEAAGDLASMVRFVEQPEPRGAMGTRSCAHASLPAATRSSTWSATMSISTLPRTEARAASWPWPSANGARSRRCNPRARTRFHATAPSAANTWRDRPDCIVWKRSSRSPRRRRPKSI